MKNRKVYILAPICTMILAFILVSAFDVSYSASDSYRYVRRNMLSHHYIKNNKSNTASGTILVKTGTRTSASDGDSTVVYCAEQGVNNSTSSHTKKALNSVSTSLVSKTAKEKLNVMMQYAYPYVSLTELKNYLKDSTIGITASEYSSYNFDNLDAQESMTAVQAAIWNAMKNTDKFVYGKTVPSISSSQSSFKGFGKVNWQSCGGYNTGTGNLATILTTEEKEWYNANACNTSGNFYKYVYNVKSDGLSEERINTLISWYATLVSKNVTIADDTSFSIKSHQFTQENGTLTLDVIIDSEGSDYSVTFYDYSGNEILAKQSVTGSANGNQFTITNLPFQTTGINAVIDTSTTSRSVYYYQGSGQDWIGVDTAPKAHSVSLPILNNGQGKVILYKVADSKVNVSIDYNETMPDESKCGTNGCLSGAYFILYANDKSTVIREFITEGSSITLDNLPDGTYYLYEQDPPYGYTKYDYNLDNVDSEGYIQIEITNGNTASVIVNNDLIKVCFTKVDSSTKEVVDGAVLRVEDAEGSTYETFTTTPQEQQYCMESRQLDSGYYYLVEESAPANYIKSDKVYKFAVGKFNPEDIVVELEESDTVVLVENVNGVVTVENKPGAVISKSDLATGACVEGATLVVTDASGKKIDEWVSSCDEGKDTHTVNLDPGIYTLTETITPNGYATSESIEFTVSENGKVSTSLDMKNDPIEVCFLKTTEGLAEGLVGAEFEIYTSDGTLYDSFTSDIVATCFPYMPVGEYTLKETKAPEGYKLEENEIKITVKDTRETQIFEIENEVEAPKTSLDYSRYIIIIASIFMIFGLGLVGYYGYKKQKQN